MYTSLDRENGRLNKLHVLLAFPTQKSDGKKNQLHMWSAAVTSEQGGGSNEMYRRKDIARI